MTGKTPFWWGIIAAARVSPDGFSGADIIRAEDWLTCPCGYQDASIKRKTSGEPEDRLLADLGLAFYDSVIDGDPEKAAVLLGSIERRACELVACSLRAHRICAWCDRVLEEGDPGANVTHCCCDECAAVLKQQAAELVAAQ